jgi:hypothetical protein
MSNKECDNIAAFLRVASPQSSWLALFELSKTFRRSAMRVLSKKLLNLAAIMLSSAILVASASADGSYKDEPVAHSQFSWI